MKRSRQAQTVLGDRHDPVREILMQVQSAACGTRPAEFFNGWARKQIRATETAKKSHKWSAVKSPLGAQTVLGDRHDPVCEILLQVQSAACGTRPAEFFNGWRRKRICDRSKERSSENLIRHRGQRNDLNPGEFASRASLRSCLGARRRARWISARRMLKPGGKSVSCQKTARTTCESMHV